MSFHPLGGGLHIFSSIYKLVTELFNHRQEGYNMLLRLRFFIHWEEGYTFFHLSTSWLCDFSSTEKRITASLSNRSALSVAGWPSPELL
jgi:hypothetical protein